MNHCYDNNNTDCEEGTGTMNDFVKSGGGSFLGQPLLDVISCPNSMLAVLVPVQLLIHLMINGKKRQQATLGKVGILSITLTFVLTFLLSWKMPYDEYDTDLTSLQSPAQFLSTRSHIVTYIFVAFLTLLGETMIPSMKMTLILFWFSAFTSSSINFYQDLKDKTSIDKSIAIFWIDLTQILVASLQCCLLCLRKKASDLSKKKHIYTHPQDKASWFSDFILFWTIDLIKTGLRRELQESDVYDLAPKDKCRNAVTKFERNLKIEELVKKLRNEENEQEFREEQEKYKIETEALLKESEQRQVTTARISILAVLLRTYGIKYFCHQVFKALLELTHFVRPVLMGVFMNHISNRENEHWTRGAAIVCFIFAMDTLFHIAHHRHWGSVLRFGKQLRASIILAVFNKALSVKNESNKDLTTGEIVNLISDDCDRVVNLSQELFHIIATPLNVGIAMYLLHDLVGSAMIVGLLIMIILIPLNRYVGKKMKALYKERDDAKDKRTKLMNEIINGIKVLKLYAWENSFIKKVQEIRRKEEECNNSISFLSACIDSMFRAIPFLVKLGSFGVYIFLGGHLDPTTGFITMHLFHILNHPFSLMPLLIPRYVEAVASLRRIEKFMNGENIPIDNVVRKKETRSSTAISISKGEFTWERSRETSTLRNINVDVPKGSLVAVVGMVGTGKSSLLSAMLGEMEKVKGHVEVQGKIAYVPQEAWILNAPLKENVLFGSSMDDARYKRVVNACALKHDINMMKAGDKTEIGEKGINLSGGQKQRVSLARALYNDADVFLFDDPLSAVDAHVGKHIFNKVISDKGLLKGKTRVLVTHGLHWLPRVDSIIVLKDGVVSETGTYEQLLSHDGAFAQFLRNALTSSSENSNSKVLKATRRTLSRLDSIKGRAEENEQCANDVNTESPLGNSSSDNSSTDGSSDEEDGTEISGNTNDWNDDENGALIDDEELEQGQVDKKVYLEYLKAIGYKMVTAFALLALITAVFDSYNSYTLKQWTDDPLLNNESLAHTEEYNEAKWRHFMLFGVSGAIEVIGAFLFVVTILSQTFQAATRLHNTLLYRILRCPMSFFDTTPSCRILTRFSKDVTRVDGLGGCLRGLVICIFNMITFLIMIIINCPTITYYLVPITVAYYILFRYHIGTIRQLRRFRSKYRSPMYTHFTETINGLSSIRAYACQNRFVKRMESHIDEFVKYDLLEHWASLGLGIRSGFLYHMIVFVTGLVCVMDSTMTAGMVGLVILFASSFTGTMNGFFWTVTHAETEIISLERVIEYSSKPSEAEWDIEETKPAMDWPSKGDVTFNSYKARYREGLDLVLKGVDCKIQSGEKVGIVGRTGAGKTSLTMGFFRLLEAADGNITVDDGNIADLGLHDLRSKINILPQEPVIFSGTLKMNLDPFGKHSDEELWTALKRSHLKSFVETVPNKLDFECGEGGKNLSVGQRQLLCLARTLLRKTKILVLDEATAAVDMETDELIQKTIRSEFSDCTVLTIAHRLNTILDYDKIMVLEYGRVKEFDTPNNLLADEESTFHSMANDAKLV